MDTLAMELMGQIEKICSEYYFMKQTNVIEKVQKIHGDIQTYMNFLLSGNIYDLDEEEYNYLGQYVVQILRDYSQAIVNRDSVLMIDTLDYGLKELLNITISADNGEVDE